MTIQEMKVGQSASVSKTVSETDVYLFAGITGDLNPAHTNQVASEKTMFKGRIAHGMLGAGFISAVLGMYMPGPGTIYMGQELKFTAPVRIGDTITATGTVTELNVEKNVAKIETVCTNQDGKVVIKGMATVMPPKA
jgi:3-hydroxybutyryl-CoA dehydratase